MVGLTGIPSLTATGLLLNLLVFAFASFCLARSVSQSTKAALLALDRLTRSGGFLLDRFEALPSFLHAAGFVSLLTGSQITAISVRLLRQRQSGFAFPHQPKAIAKATIV